MKLTVIAEALGAPLAQEHKEVQITKVCSPEQACSDGITFLSNPAYLQKVKDCSAKVVITAENQTIENKINLEVKDPYVGYARVAQLFEDRTPVFGKQISPHALIDPSASIAPNSFIGPNTVIGANVTIEGGCQIAANCVIEKNVQIGEGTRVDSGVIIRWDSVIGKNVTIQSGAVIGSDGFGNARESGVFIRIPAFGNVIIEDDADIGACTTVDRGNFEPTVIKRGVKLDNLVHIAHNVSIGEHSAIAAQTGISGSTRLGKRVIIGGQAGFVGHIEIGDDTFVGAKAGVSKDTKPGSKLTGCPARDLMGMRRIEAAQSELPMMRKELKKLQKEIDALKGRLASEA
ncbi:UDP-3-O-(3-hydroxymyristoyl)glucosamine N-acyltransferase [Chitinispirillales bacterium ANBcel5]|uniref:UDP-3-O-(3-hydroxymyristoyl)glucosamine N-acyltransferase n=1 Tax=Cellulosispirillum alkaliphilum TaxID=3039283 RepID=UPI002A56FC4D|nr:UDP-3-O-(3-hydroxymyristoyl)glucosamine N-acyltransferase [Chitinispirillales bacterium ANBcel5]